MGCPNCKKENLVNLSICPSCGTMVGDTTRKNLSSKLQPIKLPEKKNSGSDYSVPKKPAISGPLPPITLKPSPTFIETKLTETAEIVSQHTNRTLVEFQTKTNEIPEWRLQLQNAVRRKLNEQNPTIAEVSTETQNTIAVATRIDAKSETKAQSTMTKQRSSSQEELLAAALRRIENSRRRFLVEGDSHYRAQPANVATARDLALAPVREERATVSSPSAAPTNSQIAVESFYDTNELDPKFIEARVATSFGRTAKREAPHEPPKVVVPTPAPKVEKTETDSITDVRLRTSVKELLIPKTSKNRPTVEIIDDPIPDAHVESDEVLDEYDDYAPLSLRFNSGLFDLIIGSFISVILLSPFILLGGDWLSVGGFFGFVTILCAVMFIYLTIGIGLFGKTLGMKLFSLELIDIGGEEYPTFHQAAVSSSVYLLSLALFGAGFLTMFFDADHRAAHDLISGTIFIRDDQ